MKRDQRVVTKLDELLPKLQARYPENTPVAIVCDASYPAEKVVRGTLGTILDKLAGEKLPGVEEGSHALLVPALHHRFAGTRRQSG